MGPHRTVFRPIAIPGRILAGSRKPTISNFWGQAVGDLRTMFILISLKHEQEWFYSNCYGTNGGVDGGGCEER
jgi:hypothetical protein